MFVAAAGLPLTITLICWGSYTAGLEVEGLTTGSVLERGARTGRTFSLIWPGIERRHEGHPLPPARRRYCHLSVSFLFLRRLRFRVLARTPAGCSSASCEPSLLRQYFCVSVAIALRGARQNVRPTRGGRHLLPDLVCPRVIEDAWSFSPWYQSGSRTGARPEYPRALKIFAQFILTPLAFTLLVILLAYLVKIVTAGDGRTGGSAGWWRACRSRACSASCWCTRSGADQAEAWIRTLYSALGCSCGTHPGRADAPSDYLEADSAVRADRAEGLLASAGYMAAWHRCAVYGPQRDQHPDHSGHARSSAASQCGTDLCVSPQLASTTAGKAPHADAPALVPAQVQAREGSAALPVRMDHKTPARGDRRQRWQKVRTGPR